MQGKERGENPSFWKHGHGWVPRDTPHRKSACAFSTRLTFLLGSAQPWLLLVSGRFLPLVPGLFPLHMTHLPLAPCPQCHLELGHSFRKSEYNYKIVSICLFTQSKTKAFVPIKMAEKGLSFLWGVSCFICLLKKLVLSSKKVLTSFKCGINYKGPKDTLFGKGPVAVMDKGSKDAWKTLSGPGRRVKKALYGSLQFGLLALSLSFSLQIVKCPVAPSIVPPAVSASYHLFSGTQPVTSVRAADCFVDCPCGFLSLSRSTNNC